MSTKIYDGMIAVDKNVFTAQRKIKEVIEPMFYDQFFAALDMVRKSPDKTWLELFQIFGSSRYAAWDVKIGDETEYQLDFRLYDLIDTLRKDPRHTFSSVDFGYEVVLLPNGRGLSVEPLALLFSERGGNAYRAALIEADVLRDYGYWNNTDQPGDVTDAEWRQRRRAWSKLDIPRDDGLLVQIPSRASTIVEGYNRK